MYCNMGGKRTRLSILQSHEFTFVFVIVCNSIQIRVMSYNYIGFYIKLYKQGLF